MAAYPSAEVVADLASLPRAEEPGVRWTPAEQWHVTLRFLGSVDRDVAAAAFGEIDATVATASVGPRISLLGSHVVVAPVRGLDGLAAVVDRAMAEVGPVPDPRGFAGHVTLARLRNTDQCSLLGRAVSGRWTVSSISLVESRLGAAGTRHAVRATLPLVGA
ncbi:MAG: 2'-5' RNA ligase family protein [Acidimicrobiales bacterium]